MALEAHRIRPGVAYSNGDFGAHWAVRLVIAVEPGVHGGHHVSYRVLVGPQRRRQFSCALSEFARWARYEVTRNENSWERVD